VTLVIKAREGLAPVRILARRGGKAHAQTFYVRAARAPSHMTLLDAMDSVLREQPHLTSEELVAEVRRRVRDKTLVLTGAMHGMKIASLLAVADLAKSRAVPVAPPPTPNRKAHPLVGAIDFHGLKVDVENLRGSTRKGTDADGHEWSVKMRHHYGEIRRTEGADGDKVDVYVGYDFDAARVFVVHQNNPETGKYDEDKVMLGFTTAASAKAAYLKQYDRPGFFGSMDTMTLDEFKRFVLARENFGARITPKGARRQAAHVVKAAPAGLMAQEVVVHPQHGAPFTAIRYKAGEKPKRHVVRDPNEPKPMTRHPETGKKLPRAIPGYAVAAGAFRFVSDKKYIATFTGRRGDTQYVYPEAHIERARDAKFKKMLVLRRRLPKMRRQVEKDLARPDPLDTRRQQAAVTWLLDHTYARIGHEGTGTMVDGVLTPTYSISTLRPEHISASGDKVTLDYLGKAAEPQHHEVRNAAVAETLRALLASSKDEDAPVWGVNDSRVRSYVKRLTGLHPHLIRTFHVNRLLVAHLAASSPESTEGKRTRQVNAAIKEVAAVIGHGAGTCKNKYVMPTIFDRWVSHGDLRTPMNKALGPCDGEALLFDIIERMGYTASDDPISDDDVFMPTQQDFDDADYRSPRLGGEYADEDDGPWARAERVKKALLHAVALDG